MAARDVTSWVIVSALVLLILYDIGVVAWTGQENSITEVVTEHLFKYPVIGFMAGWFCCHLFWPRIIYLTVEK